MVMRQHPEMLSLLNDVFFHDLAFVVEYEEEENL